MVIDVLMILAVGILWSLFKTRHVKHAKEA